MKPVKEFVDMAIEKKFKVEALDGGIFVIDYPLNYNGVFRYQRVYVRDFYDNDTKKQSYFINSYICDYTSQIDLARILREASFGRLTMICFKTIPNGNGGEKEALYTQTTIPCNFINGSYDEFMAIVFEAASNADYIEKIFHSQDLA
jgi:hypothetical protein